MPRKTIEVAYILEKGNYFLANSEDSQTDERKGVASMIELALHHVDAYAGFGYLVSAGLRRDPTYNEAWERYRAIEEIRKAYNIESDGRDYPRWENYCKDDTRRVYYMKKK